MACIALSTDVPKTSIVSGVPAPGNISPELQVVSQSLALDGESNSCTLGGPALVLPLLPRVVMGRA
jgi:hypothetical protein